MRIFGLDPVARKTHKTRNTLGGAIIQIADWRRGGEEVEGRGWKMEDQRSGDGRAEHELAGVGGYDGSRGDR